MSTRDIEDISNNRRIAKNTVILYMRQILILAINLYTSRLVLNALGTDDYGIYQVVGGFVSMFNIISGAFTVAITRFMSREYVSRDPDDVSRCYSVSLMIQSGLGIIISILIATVGVWYVKNIMVLPKGRTNDALIVLAFSAAAFFISLISSPFNALIVANERMQAFAYIGLAEAGFKLFVAFVILKASRIRLIIYGALMMFASLMVLILYFGYCKKHFRECRFIWAVDKRMLKSMLGFISWAFLGNGSVVIKNQGVNMVLNYFGGTAVNAARGIANSVNSAVVGFSNNFIQAIQPQITKLCSVNQKKKMIDLICLSTKCSFFLLLIFCLPILKNLQYILYLWLGQVPDFTVVFLVMTLLESLIQSLGNPMLYGILATGKIKIYEILLSIIYVSSLPLSYAVLKLGYPMVSAYYVTVMLAMALHILLVMQSRKTYGLSLAVFIKRVILRIAATAAPAAVLVYLISFPVESRFAQLVLETVFSIAATGTCILLFGISGKERNALFSFVWEKIRRHTG